MIENIRKYNILIIIGLVVVAAALVIGLQTGSMGGPGGAPYIKIGSRTYTDNEYRQLGIHGREIVDSLARGRDSYRLYSQFLIPLAGNSIMSSDPDEMTETFFINRMLVRQSKEDFGIHPSEEQINEFTRSLVVFTDANQEFDQEIYERFIEKRLGRMGMTERHFRDLISDIIATGHLRAIVSSGLQVHPVVITSSSALDKQKITGSVARIEIGPFKEKINPTDEELKTYWELIKDAFKTEEQRRFSYILVGPEPVEEQAATEENKEPTLAEAAMTDEQKAAAAKKKAEKEAAKAAEIAEAKRKAQNKINLAFDKFIIELENAKGKDMEVIAAKEDYNWEVKTTGMISQDNAPTDLKLSIRNSNRGENAADQLFRMITTTDPISKISQPMPVGENQWLVVRLDETLPSRVQTFEEAREQVRKQYIDEKASEELKKAIDAATSKVAAALTEGKDFTQASTDADLKDVEPFLEIDSSSSVDDKLFPNRLFQLARTIEPGKTSESIIQGDRAFLIHVVKREIAEGSNSPDRLDSELSIAANQNAMAAFGDWLQQQSETSNINRLYKR